jgi:hypothetical protein
LQAVGPSLRGVDLRSVLFPLKFNREYADKRVKLTRCYDVRIESILLDVNIKRKDRVLVVIGTRIDRILNDGLQ